ncbi:hypothetical protein FACS189444_1370 [Spirochaetia bacterium]|nr:hypothetical protein FACS189444_1370 [Spirochaetia bacterium]
MKLFLCGPIGDVNGVLENSKNQEHVIRFRKAKQRLESVGYKVFCPPIHVKNPKSRKDALTRDLQGLLRCDNIAVMEGWEDSSGCGTETMVGRALSMTVATVDEWVEQKLRDAFSWMAIKN